MSKKKLLRKVEGKKHDRKPPYSRKRRGFTPQEGYKVGDTIRIVYPDGSVKTAKVVVA